MSSADRCHLQCFDPLFMPQSLHMHMRGFHRSSNVNSIDTCTNFWEGETTALISPAVRDLLINIHEFIAVGDDKVLVVRK